MIVRRSRHFVIPQNPTPLAGLARQITDKIFPFVLVPRALLDRARVDLDSNDAKAAVAKCDQAIRLNSRDADAWFLKGLAILRTAITEKDMPSAILLLSTRWNDPLDHQEHDVRAVACACLREAVRLSKEYRSKIAAEVTGTWTAITDECVKKIGDSVPATNTPEHIDLLHKMVQQIQTILNILKKQRHWFDSEEQFTRLTKNWIDALDKVTYRYKQLRNVERDVRLQLALTRFGSFRPSLPKNVPQGFIYVCVAALLTVILSARSDYFLPVLFTVLFLTIATAVFCLLNYRPPISPGPILDALWIKHGRKRGIEFTPTLSATSLKDASDRMEILVS